jgi:predicted DNA-binding transcriptional regulator AlpA
MRTTDMDANLDFPTQHIGFLRLEQIIGDKKKGIPAIIPVSRSSWFAGVKSGRYPKGINLGPRTIVWPVETIRSYNSVSR